MRGNKTKNLLAASAASINRRETANVSETASSAVAAVKTSGVFPTLMPLKVLLENLYPLMNGN